jgi:hypothetical protein
MASPFASFFRCLFLSAFSALSSPLLSAVIRAWGWRFWPSSFFDAVFEFAQNVVSVAGFDFSLTVPSGSAFSAILRKSP